MALFGLPGGTEWLIILAIVVLLFVPGIVLFWFGYTTGKSAGKQEAASGTARAPETPEEGRDDV